VTSLGLAAETDNPSWVVVHPNGKFLYACNEMPLAGYADTRGGVSGFAIDAASGKLTPINRVNSRGEQPAHMLVDSTGKWAIVANYGNMAGTQLTSIAVFGIGADGKLQDEPTSFVPHVGKTPNAQGALVSHPHCLLLSPDRKFLFVAEK